MSRIADRFLAKHPWLRTEDQASDRWSEFVSYAVFPLSIYFRFQVRGLQQIPPGPCILVVNHSIAAVFEILLLLRMWKINFGNRPIRGLAHQLAWQFPLKQLRLLQKIGAIFAHRDVARAALAKGHSLVVFPGGDIEVCRSFSARYQVDLAERAGVIRLARECGVPIVPLVLCAPHTAFIALPGTKTLARWSGATRFAGLKAVPMTVGFVGAGLSCVGILVYPAFWPLWCFLCLWAFLPLPSRIDGIVLPVVSIDDTTNDEQALAQLQQTMQQAMNKLAKSRWTPWG